MMANETLRAPDASRRRATDIVLWVQLMSTKIFINLPVKNLGKSIDFFTELGFSFNVAAGGRIIGFDVSPGRVYDIAVDGVGGAAGAITLNWNLKQ